MGMDFKSPPCAGLHALFDIDMHGHSGGVCSATCPYLEEAVKMCQGCPVILDCFVRAQSQGAEGVIQAGHVWRKGKPFVPRVGYRPRRAKRVGFVV